MHRVESIVRGRELAETENKTSSGSPPRAGGASAVPTASTPPLLHGYTIFLSVATFLLVVAGALVTSNDAGLSVPDWPTSFGSFRMPRMVGGVLYEHGHRMFAATVGLLTVIMAVWVWLKESRRWVKWLAGAAVLAVIAQGILGGITVLFYLPLFVSTGHAVLAQMFFCIVVTLAVTTQKDWRWDETKVEELPVIPSLRQLAVLLTGMIFLQLILGALYRHHGIGILPHLIGAIVVAVLALWIVVRIYSRFLKEDRITRPARGLLALVTAQIFLGVVAYVLQLQFRGAPQPMPPLVRVGTAHVAVGALVLAQSLVLTLQVFRRVAAPNGSSAVGRVASGENAQP
ncbi:MAG: heme A synthase [Acidobacteria bacterium]|nr:heme A synthase [Acidobacteriota bacterium]